MFNEMTQVNSPQKPSLEIKASPQLPHWLTEQKVSLAFTTYQAGKIFFIGLQSDGRLSIFERTFNRCMGLWATPQTIWLSSLYQLWRFENALEPNQLHEGYDRLYIPQMGYTTGNLDIHDVVIDKDERVIFVNTLFSCLGTVSETHSFIPLWKPKFISQLAPQDRCHLNGLALENGLPRYVTLVGQTDTPDGWRETRKNGGCVIDVTNDEIVATGLSMPHSPRVYQNNLWLHNSGTGYFGKVDIHTGKFEPVTFCPGYLRGLAFINDYAVVGISKPRENKTFSNLALDDNLAARKTDPYCGLLVIDLKNGEIVHSLLIDGIVSELYDVAILPGVKRPMNLGFKSSEIRQMINVGSGKSLFPK
ncbi:MAG: TIGR03032 family protein [Xenococcaceae cyanobacterium MO_188.B19]|nr:TIGR03032 family protein [Xenococcaceae cyanobacterium MO_188.B19]